MLFPAFHSSMIFRGYLLRCLRYTTQLQIRGTVCLILHRLIIFMRSMLPLFMGLGDIFLANGMGYWVFNVDYRRWSNFESFANPFPSSSRYPFVLKGATAIYKNLMIAFTMRGMLAYSIAADGSCTDVTVLKELNPPTSLEDSTVGFVRPLDEDGLMCFVYRMITETAATAIYVSIFQVKLDDGGRVSADLLRYHIYDADMVVHPFFPRHLFIVSDESNKRSLEYKEHARSSRKGKLSVF